MAVYADFGQAYDTYRGLKERENALTPTQNQQPQNALANSSALDIAGSAIGLNETDKAAALNDYLQNGGVNLDPQTAAWCAAFVNSTLSQAGMEGTGSNLARSFMEWGNPVDQPRAGDIAVFSRGDPNSWQGHVGFYQGTNPDGSINVLGGNQSDAVSVASYPANRLLGYRRGY